MSNDLHVLFSQMQQILTKTLNMSECQIRPKLLMPDQKQDRYAVHIMVKLINELHKSNAKIVIFGSITGLSV